MSDSVGRLLIQATTGAVLDEVQAYVTKLQQDFRFDTETLDVIETWLEKKKEEYGV